MHNRVLVIISFVNNRTKSKYTCINVISLFLHHLSMTHLELKNESKKISNISIIQTKVQTV